jgi:hypothetical protein
MAGSWFAVAVGAVDHPKLLGLRSDEARWAWLVVLSAAKRQDPEGGFASLDHVRHKLGSYAQHADELLEVGLLDRLATGSIVVHDWSDWQLDRQGRFGQLDRQARYRLRHREELAEKARERRRSDARGDARSDTVATSVATRGDSVATPPELTVATGSDASRRPTGTGTGTRSFSPSLSPPLNDDPWWDLLVELAVATRDGHPPSPAFVQQIGRWADAYGGKVLVDEVGAAIKRREADPWNAAVTVLAARQIRGRASSGQAGRSRQDRGKYAAITERDEGVGA